MFKLIYKGRVRESGFKCAIYPLCAILKRPWHFWLIAARFSTFLGNPFLVAAPRMFATRE